MKNYNLKYNKINECEILIFGDDLKLLKILITFQDETLNL